MRRRTKLPAGLEQRGGYYRMRFRGTPLGADVRKSLETDDYGQAIARYSAIIALQDRADWRILRRWIDGELRIADVQAAVRDGDFDRLRRTREVRVGPEAQAFMRTVKATLSKSSYQTYLSKVRQLLAFLGADPGWADADEADGLEPGRLMSEVTTADAEAFIHGDKPRRNGPARPWSGNTQEMAAKVAGALWSRVIDQQAEIASIQGTTPAVTLNPWKRVKVSAERRTRTKFLTHQQWEAVLNVCRGTPRAAFLGCAFLAGLRQSEIRMLRVEDVNLGEEPFIRIQDRESPHRWSPKSRRSVRDVQIGARLKALLFHHMQTWTDGVYVFTTGRKDAPIEQHTSDRWTREVFEAAGLTYGGEGFTLHHGRHSYASWMAQEGVPAQVAAELLGHTVAVYVRNYSHLVPHTKRKAVDHLEMVLALALSRAHQENVGPESLVQWARQDLNLGPAESSE